jgi:hypothetical protein
MRTTICIILTILIFISARYFGPNREYTIEGTLGNATVQHTAPRGHDFAIPGDRDKPIEEIRELGRTHLDVTVKPAPEEGNDLGLRLQLKLQSADQWDTYPVSEVMPGEDGAMLFRYKVPGFPWTSRVDYRFVTAGEGGERIVLARENDEPMMLKFKGPVPGWVWIPHVLFMFAGICFLMMAMWGAIGQIGGREEPKTARLAWWAWAAMFIGGVPIGCMMNYYAFNVLWEAVPFGNDITDNKTQVALVFWGLAAIFLTRRPGRHAGLFALGAGLLSLAMYLIPHSI